MSRPVALHRGSAPSADNHIQISAHLVKWFGMKNTRDFPVLMRASQPLFGWPLSFNRFVGAETTDIWHWCEWWTYKSFSFLAQSVWKDDFKNCQFPTSPKDITILLDGSFFSVEIEQDISWDADCKHSKFTAPWIKVLGREVSRGAFKTGQGPDLLPFSLHRPVARHTNQVLCDDGQFEI